jgi:hypothetical protein
MDSGRSVLVALLGSVSIVCGAAAPLAAQTAAAKAPPAKAPAAAACGADIAKSLAGLWRAPQYRMKRSSEIGTQVFGPNAFDVRDVELTLQPSGEGLLKITTSVVDAKKRTWAPTAIEAKLMLGAAELNPVGRCAVAVKVTGAEEVFLDETKYRSTLEGAEVRLLMDQPGKQFELRFETPEGDGSFWSTLTRQK